MPKKYSPEVKSKALLQLEQNGGDIQLTALQLGISERTLYTWRRGDWLQQSLQQRSPLPLLQKPTPTFQTDHSFFDFLRQQIMDELARLASSFQDNAVAATPHQRALILTQLLDRLIKLDDHRKPYRPPTIYRIAGSAGEEPYVPQQSVNTARNPVDAAGNASPPERNSGE